MELLLPKIADIILQLKYDCQSKIAHIKNYFSEEKIYAYT